jgi:hypothetical protein
MRSSTLLTSPVSQFDFLARLAFFALAPVAIVPVTLLFPVTGTLISVGLFLVVFFAGESARGWVRRWPRIWALIGRELEMERFYRRWPPRPFLYYAFYPLLFPYWLYKAEPRREFWFFKGYTATGLVVLLVTTLTQYFWLWPPELDFANFLPVLGLSLLVEAILVLWLLMPLVTSVVWLHQTFRRRRLILLLTVGLLSTSYSVVRVAQRRDPVVSYSTRYRVRERTEKHLERAHAAQLAGLRQAWNELHQHPDAIDGDGKVLGHPLELAHEELERYYKRDEAFAFDLWAVPRKQPHILILYFEGRRKQEPIWVALRDNVELSQVSQLPTNAFTAMRRATH